MTKQLKAWGLLLSLLTVTACTTVSQGGPVENSPRYIQAPIQEYIDEWMTYRNGTIIASGNAPYYYDGEETSAVDTNSTDMRYDLPGEHCYLTENDNESAYVTLNVATSPRKIDPVDLDQELEKVSAYWRSQGITDIRRGAEAIDERQIVAVTPHGTRMMYTIRNWEAGFSQLLRMDSLCAKEFGGNSPSYLGDFEERFNTTPTPSHS